MTFKFRNKTLYYTLDGFKNRYRPKVLNTADPIVPENTAVLIGPLDHHSFVRTV